MCDRCSWRETDNQIRIAIREDHAKLRESQKEWLEAISVTINHNLHVTDRQKAVAKRIMREAGIDRWRKIPKVMDRSRWSEDRRKRYRERKKKNRMYDRYGQP